MNTSWSADPVLRERRKKDLLLASKLLRLQADALLQEIARPVDLWAGRFAVARQTVHELASRPPMAAGAGGLAFLFALWWRARRPGGRAQAWGRVWGLGWTAWRLWSRWRRAERVGRPESRA